MKLLRMLSAGLLLALCAGGGAAQGGPADLKVIRYSFPIAESGFDPPQISDLYSRTLAAAIYDGPLEFEFLAKPVRMRPNTLVAMPEVSDNFRTYTMRVKPGIYFADDPAFKGRKRELVAEDYVYSIKRYFDPRWKSAALSTLENEKILGISELRRQLIAERKPFDYDTPVEGLRTLDRYTFQVRLAQPSPRFVHNLVGSLFGAVAREVVEAYGDAINEHPVGTGPFMLKSWQRSSRIVLVRNPGFREQVYDEQPPQGDARLQQIAGQLKGRRLPMVDEVRISVIEETQPRWLSFLNGEQDIIENVPADFATIAFPNNHLAPNLAKRGIQMVRYPRADIAASYFAMENPVVGGYTPEKVALRRAIALAVDVEREIRLVRRGQAIPAQGPIGPQTSGYNPAFKSEMGQFDRARAKALLDMYGYVDANGDGWRDQPDGSPLLLEYATSPDQQSRQLTEQWKKNMDAIGIRIEFKIAKWPEQLKASRAGKLMMWGFGWSTDPDGEGFLNLGYGPSAGQANHARFRLPAFDALYDKQHRMPDGPERDAVMADAAKLMIAYMPYKVHVHRIWTDLAQPWVVGYNHHTFNGLFWKYVDIDTAELQRRGGGSM